MQYIYRAGKDYVKADIKDDDAKRIIAEGEVKEDDTFKDFPVCVNGDMWFPETEPKLKVVKGRKAPKMEEAPVEEVPFEGAKDEADD